MRKSKENEGGVRQRVSHSLKAKKRSTELWMLWDVCDLKIVSTIDHYMLFVWGRESAGGKVKIYWKCQASGDCSRLESWEKKQKREIEKVRELQGTTRKQKSTWNMNKCVNEYNIKHSKAPLALTWNLLKQGCSGCFDFGEQQIEYVARWLNWRGVEDEKVRWNVCRTPAQADIDSC